MKYINLIDQLSDLDKKRIENYISLYGVSSHFIGIDKWLQNWSHSKQKLYKLLGNSLIKEIDFDYNYSPQNNAILRVEIDNLISNSAFITEYTDFCNDCISNYLHKEVINYDTYLSFFDLIAESKEIIFKDTTKVLIKLKKSPNAKLLQIQPGTKIIKAFNRIINYFSDEYTFDKNNFEKFKTQCSILMTTKNIKAKMVFSIHPLDFLTMSDNDSNWTSCMSWTQEGCYYLGTVEMMNSNNVICCYLKRDVHNYFFGDNKELLKNKKLKDDVSYQWNNKIWRNLVYITKDIIMSGKSYPYEQDYFSKNLIKEVKQMAEDNLHWHYHFGPELYHDMDHINNIYTMDSIRNKIYYSNNRHNIIWDTNGMYNDMFNSHSTKYWCYRNKVTSTKIISVSGKAPCLCCGESVLEDGDYEDYNERYSRIGNTICSFCETKYFTCNYCGFTSQRKTFYPVTIDDTTKYYCQDCYENKKYLKIIAF